MSDVSICFFYAYVVCDLTQHCLTTGHSVSKNNTRVLSREQEWRRRKVKEAIYIKQQGATMNRDQGYQLPPPSTHLSFRRYLGQVTDSRCVIKICRSRSKSRSFVSANSLQSKFKVTITYCVVGSEMASERSSNSSRDSWIASS